MSDSAVSAVEESSSTAASSSAGAVEGAVLAVLLYEQGGEVRFHCLLQDIRVKDGKLCGAQLMDTRTGASEVIEASELVLAIGHSSRDTFAMLERRGFVMQPREFAVGVRIEHLQREVSRSQYGPAWEKLPRQDLALSLPKP